MYHKPSNGFVRGELYVKGVDGQFYKLPPKKKKHREIDWKTVVFLSLFVAGLLTGKLLA